MKIKLINFWGSCWASTPLLAFLCLTLLYLFSAKGHIEIIDTEYSIRTARAIVEEGSLLIEPVDPDLTKVAPVVVDGKIYSKYGIGLAIIFVPFVLAAKFLSMITGMPKELLEGFLISFYNVPFALGGLYYFYQLAKLLGAKSRHAALGVILLGIGTFHWKYGVTDYSESTQTFFLLGGIFFFLRNESRDLLFASLMLSCLVLIKVVYVALLPLFVLYLMHRENWRIQESLKACIRFGSVLIVTGVALAIFNYLRFGNWMETGYGKHAMGGWGWDYFKRDIIDIIFSPDRGCYAFNPILIAALPGWYFLAKRKAPIFFLFLAITIAFFFMMAFRHTYQGGWAWGPRTIVPTVPLLWLPFIFTPLSKNWQKVTIGSIALISCYFQTASVSQKTQEYFVIYEGVQTRHPEIQGEMPSQLMGNIILFNHKLLGGGTDGIYPLSLLGTGSSATISTADKETFRGFNFWYSHMARRFSQPILHAGGVILAVSLAGLLVLAVALIRQVNYSSPSQENPSSS